MKTVKENFKKVQSTQASAKQVTMVENLKDLGLLKAPKNNLVYGPDVQKLAFSNELSGVANCKQELSDSVIF